MRSQPPFLTDLALQVYGQLDPANEAANKDFLKRAIQGAIEEYHIVWQEERRLDSVTGLSRYRPDGLGIPPETEASHFTAVLQPYADKHGISVNEFTELYDSGEVEEPALDEYFLHDRGVRESGHDTTYRFEKRCANLGTIDLCSLLYKYEIDIATTIRDHFGDSLDLTHDFALTPFPFGSEVPYTAPTDSTLPDLTGPRRSTGAPQTSAEWFARAARRKDLADHYLWHEGRGIYVDYDCKKGKQSLYDSVTTFWPMWCGMASEQQAEKIMFVPSSSSPCSSSPFFLHFSASPLSSFPSSRLFGFASNDTDSVDRRRQSLNKFEVAGGLVSGTESSRGRISLQRPNRQWECVPPFFSVVLSFIPSPPPFPSFPAFLSLSERADTNLPLSYPAAWPPHQIMACSSFSVVSLFLPPPTQD